jgi:hypothetical protein
MSRKRLEKLKSAGRGRNSLVQTSILKNEQTTLRLMAVFNGLNEIRYNNKQLRIKTVAPTFKKL